MIIKIKKVEVELKDKIPALLEEHKNINIRINHLENPLNLVLEKHPYDREKLIIKKVGDKDLGWELGVIEFIVRFFFMETGIDCDVEIKILETDPK